MLGLRLGERPRAVVTTTPRPIPLVRRILALERVAETRGRTLDNVHLCEDFTASMLRIYGGTRIGRQELDGELIEDVEGALWSRELIEASRTQLPLSPTLSPEGEREFFARIVVGVDPPAGVGGAACGIVVAGLGRDGVGYVLADASVKGLSPEKWAAAVARAAATWQADRVIAEANNGGKMIESLLRGVERNLPLRLVHASDGKAARAEPVAALFERGVAKFAGTFRELEDELAGLTIGGGYEGPGGSPDRADACVWALTELMLGRQQAPPRVTFL
jgi:phage terminase large subunit-like protein